MYCNLQVGALTWERYEKGSHTKSSVNIGSPSPKFTPDLHLPSEKTLRGLKEYMPQYSRNELFTSTILQYMLYHSSIHVVSIQTM